MSQKSFIEQASKWLKDYEYEAKLVQYFEQKDTLKLNNQLKLQGTEPKLAFSGYISLIKAYIAINNDNSSELKELCETLENNLKYLLLREQLGKDVIKELNEKNYSYCSYISHENRHANFIKFYKKDEEYFCTLYNAGAYIDKVQQNAAIKHKNVSQMERSLSEQYFTFPAVTYKIKSEYGDIERTINEIVKESGSISNLEISNRNKKRFFSPTVSFSNDVVHTQKSGNCSTRSIRELLRDNLPKSTFRELFDFITNTPYSTITSALNQTQKQGSIALDIEIPASLVKVMNIIKDQTNASDKLLNDIHRILSENEDVNKFLSSKEGAEFVINKITNDISNATVFNTNGKLSSKVNLTNFRFYDRGFNQITKKILIEDCARSFAKDHKTNEELTVKLWNKMFAASFTDLDLPITKEVLEPVKKSLSNIIKTHKKLTKDNLGQILEKWQLETITSKQKSDSLMSRIKEWIKKYFLGQDNKITLDSFFDENRKILTENSNLDLTIKAPILKGLLDNNIEKYGELRGVKILKDSPVLYYYQELQKIKNLDVIYDNSKSQVINADKSKSSFFQKKINLEKKLQFNKLTQEKY